ncbi:MAG: hypothetical protein FJ098_07480, partial [Deltaproteobacteria bacterium]|nr:hypothetical protein [Deltaproteobacteria bacterium]
SLPFLPPGQERGALLREASRRLLAARDLRGVLALWGPDGGEPALDGRLLSEAALALDPAAPGEEARLLLERLPVLHGTGALLDPEAAARLAEAALRVQEPGALPVTAAALAPSLHAGGDAAIRLAGALEGAIPPGELLALLRSMRPAAAAAGPAAAAWVNLVFRTHVAAGFPTEAWHVLAGCDEPESPDDRSLDVIVSLVGGAATRTRALSEMVRWVERSPDRLRRAAVAGRLGIVLLDELRLPADAARYLELAWQLDREPHRWLPGLERALEASGREADLAELLATVLEDPGLAPDTEGSLHLRRGRVLLRIPGQRLEALAHLHRARELLPGEQAPERELAAAQASAPGPSRPGPGVPHQLDLACREAVALADAGDLEAARTLVRSVLAEAPDHAAAADLLDALGSGRT